MSAGFVRQVGWTHDEDGNRIFRAIVVYPDGPPGDLKGDVVFKSLPVKIVVLSDELREHAGTGPIEAI